MRRLLPRSPVLAAAVWFSAFHPFIGLPDLGARLGMLGTPVPVAGVEARFP